MNIATGTVGKQGLGTLAALVIALGWALTIWLVILGVVALVALFTVSPRTPPAPPPEDPAPTDPPPPEGA